MRASKRLSNEEWQRRRRLRNKTVLDDIVEAIDADNKREELGIKEMQDKDQA